MTAKTALAEDTALTQTMENREAARLRKREPGMYQKIEMRITQGLTPEDVERWLDKWYGWPENSNVRVMCINAAKSIYRKNETGSAEWFANVKEEPF